MLDSNHYTMRSTMLTVHSTISVYQILRCLVYGVGKVLMIKRCLRYIPSTVSSMSKPDQNIDHLSVDPNLIHVQYITELLCERDQLLARIAELESTVLKLESFVDLHYARIRES